MKITRHKKVQRFLGFYTNFFKFHEPYQLLVDGTFCFAARQEKINIREQLPKYLSADVKLVTTKCVILETELIAKKALGASTIIKQFGVHQCGHRDALTGADCILSMVGKDNPSHYVVATQDRALQDLLRKVPGVPLIYLHKKSPTLEKPSEVSCEFSKVQKESCTMTESQESTIRAMKESSGLPTDEPVEIKRKKRRKGGPNPLSCLKKKKKPTMNVTTHNKAKARKRIRVRIAAHIKNMNAEKST